MANFVLLSLFIDHTANRRTILERLLIALSKFGKFVSKNPILIVPIDDFNGKLKFCIVMIILFLMEIY